MPASKGVTRLPNHDPTCSSALDLARGLRVGPDVTVRRSGVHTQGILGADLVSFNHFDYVRHFLNSCTRILGLESFPSRIEHNGRWVALRGPGATFEGRYSSITLSSSTLRGITLGYRA
jgi:hypothetical protein